MSACLPKPKRTPFDPSVVVHNGRWNMEIGLTDQNTDHEAGGEYLEIHRQLSLGMSYGP